MTSSRVLQPSTDELRARRDGLVRRTGMTRAELEQRADEGTLDTETFWLWEDIRALEFLLDGDVER